MENLQKKEYKSFENIKHIRKDGTEYWYARELSEVFQYVQWRNFSKVIDKAKIACENSGRNTDYDFAEVSKIVEAGRNYAGRFAYTREKFKTIRKRKQEEFNNIK